jgi:hypothetical protein
VGVTAINVNFGKYVITVCCFHCLQPATSGKSNAGIVDPSGKFTTMSGVIVIHVKLFDNDSKFAASVNDASNQYVDAITDTGGAPLHLEMKISLRIKTKSKWR